LNLINILSWPIRIIYTVYTLLLFVVLMLLFFPIIFIASFWGKTKGGNFVYKVLRVWGAIWFPAIGIFCKNIYEQKPDPKHHYIFVANHISYLDATLIVMAIRQKFRPLGKVEMKKIPVFGFIYSVCVVMVDRSNAEHRAKSVRQLKSVLNKGISILIFPEGTFNLTDEPLKDFYDGAFRIAIETKAPILPILFLDSYDRMHYRHLFTLTPGKSRAVFLEEIPTVDYNMKNVGELKKKVFEVMAGKLKEYGAGMVKRQ
jgi:1-acyl-sn-glycerol-3-phosphate acyltransferase